MGGLRREDPLKGFLPHLRYAFETYRRHKDMKYRTFRYDGERDGNPLQIVYAKDFGPHSGGTGRWVLSIGFRTKRAHTALLLQRYATGFELGPHVDGPERNDLILLELRRPKKGGVFFADEGAKNWLGGRLWALNGGVVKHGFSRIEEGQRVTLLVQRGQEKGRCP